MKETVVLVHGLWMSGIEMSLLRRRLRNAGYHVVQRELGSIAGTRSLGIAQLVGNLPLPNDGTVALGETELPGACDTLRIPASHSGLLLSREAARQTVDFLSTGCFAHLHL